MLAVALVGFRLIDSGSTDVAYADPAVTLAIDVDLSNGVCGTNIDDYVEVDPSIPGGHDVAICLIDLPSATYGVSAFSFDLLYDDTLNECVPVTCPADPGTCLDDNPDVNAGSDNKYGDGLGGTDDGDWSCKLTGATEPVCDADSETGAQHGAANANCLATDGPYTMGDNETNGVLAVVSFDVLGPGTDVLHMANTNITGSDGMVWARCDPGTACTDSTVEKLAPPPQCDMSDEGMVSAAPHSLSMKIGEHDSIDLTETIENLGATSGDDAANCYASIIWTVVDAATGVYPNPAKLNVRLEPRNCNLPPYITGDVCYTGNIEGTKVDEPGTDPTTEWWSISCDEQGKGTYFACYYQDSCQNGVDDDDPADGTIDWAPYAADIGATADPDCTDITGLILAALNPPLMVVDTPQDFTRTLKVACNQPGSYTLAVVGTHTMAREIDGVTLKQCFDPDTGDPIEGGCYDPDEDNDQSMVLIPVICGGLAVAMEKDVDPNTEGVQDTGVLWLMDPELGCQTDEQMAEGKGCLGINVVLSNVDDIDNPNDEELQGDELKEGLGAWEHQVKYEHKIVRIETDLLPLTVDTDGDDVADTPWIEVSWLTGEKGRDAICTATVLTENYILEGCVTKDGLEPPAGGELGNVGDGVIATMVVKPMVEDLMYRDGFRPTKDNGVITDILDENCEITDTQAEEMTGLLPGGLTPVCGDAHIAVRMLEGDLNLDCVVDVKDDAAIAFRYGSFFGLLLYDQWFDLEPKYADFDIDIKDLQFVYGRNWSTCQDPIPNDQSVLPDLPQP